MSLYLGRFLRVHRIGVPVGKPVLGGNFDSPPALGSPVNDCLPLPSYRSIGNLLLFYLVIQLFPALPPNLHRRLPLTPVRRVTSFRNCGSDTQLMIHVQNNTMPIFVGHVCVNFNSLHYTPLRPLSTDVSPTQPNCAKNMQYIMPKVFSHRTNLSMTE